MLSHGLLDALVPVMREAGELIEAVRVAGFETRGKTDLSPVTEADERAEALITAVLTRLDPWTPIVAEEAHAAGHRPPPAARFWLIDPLDGTRDFVAGRPAYSVNIALIEDDVPVLGLVLSPRDGVLWAGAHGAGAFRERPGEGRAPIHTRRAALPPTVVVSHSHLDDATREYLSRLGMVDLEPAGSSLKFCRLAEGSADVYPRYGPTMEWDTAAGDAVLRAAGGAMVGPSGRPFAYAKPGYRNGAFLAVGDPALIATLPPLEGRDAGPRGGCAAASGRVREWVEGAYPHDPRRARSGSSRGRCRNRVRACAPSRTGRRRRDGQPGTAGAPSAPSRSC